MPRYDQIIADAKVALTDIAMKSINTAGSGLRVRAHVDELTRQLGVLEEDRRGRRSVVGRLKDAMFDTDDDATRSEAARQAMNLTYQLNNCLRCRCITCAKIDGTCRCEGCLFGSRVADCEGGTGVETRQVEKGVCLVDGMPVVRAEFDRRGRGTTVTLLDRSDVERRYSFDPATGKKGPL